MKTSLKFIAEHGKYIEKRKEPKLFKKVRVKGVTKHKASKKNHRHIPNLSLGELNHQKFLDTASKDKS